MSDFWAVVVGWYFVISFVYALVYWARWTDRSEGAFTRRLHATINGLTWPVALVRYAVSRTTSREDRSNATHGSLPPDIVSKMETFGQHDFDYAHTPHPELDAWRDIVSPLLPYAQANPSAFLRDLADRVLPAGGWAVYGGERVVKDVLSGDIEDQSYHRMLDEALAFIRFLGVPNSRLNGYEWSRWRTTHGPHEVWLRGKSIPGPNSARLTPLADGERRLLARVPLNAGANSFFAVQQDRLQVSIVINGPRSDSDLTTSDREWKTFHTLYDSFVELGRALEIPPTDINAELLPFVPLDKPRVPWLP